jgi:transposase InsO family protein
MEIAEEMGLNYYTVRKWWRRYRDKGWSGIESKAPGPQAKGALSTFDSMVKYTALRLKREHPGWGVDVLLLHLSRRASLKGKNLPKRSQLGVYLKQFGNRLYQHRRLPTTRPQSKVETVADVHQSWQMDFKGEEKLPELGTVKPLMICDELTSAPLGGIIHITRKKHQKFPLSFRDVQADLRIIFTQWGLPNQIRMDRDALWIGSSRLEWPGTILLWLIGLGIQPVINRPGRPTDNAKVERLNRTWNEMVWVGNRCKTTAELQRLTDQAWHDRRTFLPSRNPACNGLPPLVAHPELAQPRRSYSPDQENGLFNIDRVYAYLSQWVWQRKVSSSGFISLADTNLKVSRSLTGQIVKVRFDPEEAVFCVHAVDGHLICHLSLSLISEHYILGDIHSQFMGTDLPDTSMGSP